MDFLRHHSLRPYNTFGMEAQAEWFTAVSNIADLQEALHWAKTRQLPVHIIGGGSNILLTQHLQGLVILNAIKGLELLETESNNDSAVIAAGSGEIWHDLVCWCLERNLGGIENLSLIPGTVGAAPIQNIGAYGVEIKDVFEKLEAVSLVDGSVHSFDKASCHFAYRDSVFKQHLKGQFFITKVYLRLSKGPHQLHTSYGALEETLEAMSIRQATIQDVSRAVIWIRSSKLPKPEEIGNAGSFFKNPEIEPAQFEQLKNQYPHLISFPGAEGRIKIPAGWLIDQCGWRGYRQGDAGCYDKQALVLVNYGQASGTDVWTLAQQIVVSVKERFGIELSPEVNIW